MEKNAHVLVQIPRNFQDKVLELHTFDFENKNISFWITGITRNNPGMKCVTLQEVIIPPAYCCEVCSKSTSKIKEEHIVGILTTSRRNFSLEVKRKLSKKHPYIVATLIPEDKEIKFEYVVFEKANISSICSERKNIYEYRMDVVTQKLDLDIVLTDCRPKSERSRLLHGSLGNPFTPSGILRQLTAYTYEPLTTNDIIELHYNGNKECPSTQSIVADN